MEGNKINQTQDIDSYENFKIETKQPKIILNYHKNYISCSTVLKDGRFVTGSKDKSIIIYNKETFKPVLMIREHKEGVRCIIQLSSGELASCSEDNTIKIFKINENQYEKIQELKEHKNWVNKIIELKNKQLVSCSFDHSIIFYNKDNNAYIKDYSITANGFNGPIIQTKDEEICFYEDNNTLCFYDIIKKEIINKIKNINAAFYNYDSLLMVSKDLLIVTGKNKITIVNVNSHSEVKAIEVSESGLIFAACMLNKNVLLTSDENKRIIQWKLKEKENDLELISKKENAHDSDIYVLSKLGNGLILSGGFDGRVKIW